MSVTISVESIPPPYFRGDFDPVENIFRAQIFTPGGRYGLSAYYEGGCTSGNSCRHFFVVDLLNKELNFYKHEDDSFIFKWICYYFVNDCQLILIFADETGFKQQLLELCHEQKRIKVLGTRFFPYSDRDDVINFDGKPLIFGFSHYGQTIKYEEEDFIILMVSTSLTTDAKLILLPKDPSSNSEMKIFLIKRTLPNNNNEVIRGYNEKGIECYVYETITIIDGYVCFPVTSLYRKFLLEVYISIDLTKLVKLKQNEEINKERLQKKQEAAYSVISTPFSRDDREVVSRGRHAAISSNGNMFYQWSTSAFNGTPAKTGTVFKNSGCSVFDGKVRVFDYEYEESERAFQYTIHPLGLRLRWSNLTRNSVELKIENIKGPIGSLVNLVKKKMLVENMMKDKQEPDVLNLLWS